MNTSQIISTMSPSNICTDAFNIVKSIIQSMDDYDEHILETQTKPKFTRCVVKEINEYAYDVNECEKIFYQDEAIIGMTISVNYSKRILNDIAEEKQRQEEMWDEQMWQEANGYNDHYDSDQFVGWFNGASCDI